VKHWCTKNQIYNERLFLKYVTSRKRYRKPAGIYPGWFFPWRPAKENEVLRRK
jgi:hypothetical protein